MAKTSTTRCCHRAPRFRELLLVLTLILFGGLAAEAANPGPPSPFVGTVPESGSTINTFVFEFKFNTQAALDSLRKVGAIKNDSDVQISTTFSEARPITIYEGDIKDGKVIKSITTANATSLKTSNSFTVDFGNIYPEDGKKYTVEFKGRVNVYV